MDEAVFSQVFGFVRWPQGDKDGEPSYLNFVATPEAGEVWYGDPPPYSTDLTEAWAIAEAMRDAETENAAETRAILAEAICRAALKALGEAMRKRSR